MTTIKVLTIVQVCCIVLTTSIFSISGTKILDARDDWTLVPAWRTEHGPGISGDLRLEPNFEHGIMRKLKRSSNDDFEEQYTMLMLMLNGIIRSLKQSAEPLGKPKKTSNNDLEEQSHDQGLMRSLKRSAIAGPSRKLKKSCDFYWKPMMRML